MTTGAALLVVASMLTAVVAAGGTALGACASTPEPSGLGASADAYVSGAAPSSNFGTEARVTANAKGPLEAHVQFVVSGSGGATTATLSVHSLSSGTTRTQVYAAPSSWTESDLTAASAPARGALLGRLSTLVAGCYSTLEVPITGDGTYSFVLTTAATASRHMASRETSTPPQLLVVGAGGPPTDDGAADDDGASDDVPATQRRLWGTGP